MVKKNYDNMLSRFIWFRNVTDRQTDLLYQYRVSVLEKLIKMFPVRGLDYDGLKTPITSVAALTYCCIVAAADHTLPTQLQISTISHYADLCPGSICLDGPFPSRHNFTLIQRFHKFNINLLKNFTAIFSFIRQSFNNRNTQYTTHFDFSVRSLCRFPCRANVCTENIYQWRHHLTACAVFSSLLNWNCLLLIDFIMSGCRSALLHTFDSLTTV